MHGIMIGIDVASATRSATNFVSVSHCHWHYMFLRHLSSLGPCGYFQDNLRHYGYDESGDYSVVF